MRADPRASCAIATRVAPTRSRPPAPHHTTQRKKQEARPCRLGHLWSLRARTERVDRTQRSTKVDPFVIKVRHQPHTQTRRKRAAPFESLSYTAQKMPVRERIPTNTRGRGGSRVGTGSQGVSWKCADHRRVRARGLRTLT